MVLRLKVIGISFLSLTLLACASSPRFYLQYGNRFSESDLEAILAATRRPAQRLGKADLFGTIAPGLAADLLLLTADPLADIRNTRRIERVIARGVVYEPERLLASVRARTALR